MEKTLVTYPSFATNKKGIVTLAAFVLILFGVSTLPIPCSAQTVSMDDQELPLVVALSSQVVSLDPTNHRDRNTQIVLKNIFDSLTSRDSNNKIVPQLAESWKALSNKKWEFKLRKGVKFHNGDALTAKDVQFTLERVCQVGGMDGKTSPRKTLLGPISKVSVVDDYTVHIETGKTWSILPLMLSLQEIVPEKHLKQIGPKAFQEKPVGSGPFRFLNKTGDGGIVIERFEGYYKNTQKPLTQTTPLKRIVFKSVPKSIDRITGLKRGEFDIITGTPPESVAILSMDPNVRIITRPATRSYFAEMNLAKAPLNNQGVRTALNFAVDKGAIVQHVLHGYGQVLTSVLLPNAFAFNDTLQPYRYDPNKARALLEESGWSDRSRVKIYCEPPGRQFADALAVFLTKVGLPCAVKVFDSTKISAALENRTGWDLYVTSWGNTTLDPVGILVPKFKTGGRGNYSRYSNPEVDQLLDLAEDTLDVKVRGDFYKKVQSIVHADAPMIFGFAAEEIYGVQKRVQYFDPSLGGMMSMHNVYVDRGE
jgi:peptide/nickel transport system substrate-binding protein